jgi:hypothetical protein
MLPFSVGDLNEDGEAAYSAGEIDTVLEHAKAMNDRIAELEARLVNEVPGPQ